MNSDLEHPYKKLENTELWKAVEKAITNLESNQDLKFTTRREYIVGYICKQLEENGVSVQLKSN
jgi:hypothetical protein